MKRFIYVLVLALMMGAASVALADPNSVGHGVLFGDADVSQSHVEFTGSTSNSYLVADPAYKGIYDALYRNLRKPSGRTPFFHVVPGPKFPGIYLWDSAFISLVWLHKDQLVAKDVIRSVLHGQKADGRIPHVIGRWTQSKYSNPPVLTWAAARVAKATGDAKFALEIYPSLRRSHEWLRKNRMLKSGMFFWEHPYESGIDNTPRFGRRDESYYYDTKNMAAIDLTSYMVLDAEALQDLAKQVLSTPATANSLSAKAKSDLRADIARLEAYNKRVVTLVRENLWDESTGYFYDRDEATKKLVVIPTIASFFPMIAGIATERQGAILLKHLANPAEFNTMMPFPTVARNHPTFEKDCWRGPVWINTAYLVLQGMKRYGAEALVKDMGERLVLGVFATHENDGHYVEFYDPDRNDNHELTRKRGTGLFGFFSGAKNPIKFAEHLFAKQMFLGRKPVTGFIGWTGLVNNIVLEDLSDSNH